MEDSGYGTMVIRSVRRSKTIIVPSQCVHHARTRSSVAWLRVLWDGEDAVSSLLSDGTLFFQFDDFAHNSLLSIAYGCASGAETVVRLIPDAYFFASEGYKETRLAMSADLLPLWSDRENKIFWRGSASHNACALDGSLILGPNQIPRVALCLKLQSRVDADIGLIGWNIGFPPPEIVEDFIKAHSICKPMVPMLEHANYKLQMDIDGVGNAWSFLDKLLMGSCILKVQSPLKQWFYDELHAWEHYVPVRSDLSDLEQQLDWCLSNDGRAKEIGEEGQRAAVRHTYDAGLSFGRQAILAAFSAS